MTCCPPPNTSTSTTSTTDQLKAPCSSSRKRPLEAEEEDRVLQDFQPPGASTPNVSCYLSFQPSGSTNHSLVDMEVTCRPPPNTSTSIYHLHHRPAYVNMTSYILSVGRTEDFQFMQLIGMVIILIVCFHFLSTATTPSSSYHTSPLPW